MNRLITLSFRKIKKSYKRFFSLVILSLLGVSFFIGMKIAMPNLIASLDDYYKKKNAFDVEIISSNGLNDMDLDAIKKLSSKTKVVALHSKDVLTNYINTNTDVIRIRELNNDINQISLLSGRMPRKANEVLIDEKYLLNKGAKIGDKLELILDDDDNSLNAKKLTIVGVINSPLYLATNEGSLNRGNTLIGNGEIKYYVYALKDIFNIDYYTEIYIDNQETDFDMTDSDIYNKKTEKLITKIDAIKDERIKYRYEELKDIALKKINKEEEKVNKEINDSKIKLNEIKSQLDSVKVNLDNTKRELDNANRELRDKQNKINETTILIQNGEKELEQKKRDLDAAKNSIDNYDNLLSIAKKNKSGTLTKNDIIAILPNDSEKQSNIEKIELASQMGADLSSLSTIKNQITQLGIDTDGSMVAKINSWEKGLDNILAIEDGYNLYNTKTQELNNYKNSLESGKKTYNEYLTQYNNGSSKYESAIKEYNEKLNRFNEAFKELIEKEESAKKEFEKARREVDEKIEPGTWLIHNRLDNIDYSGFIDSIHSLEKLSIIFPIIFFVVSIFISLLSMTRMGIEDKSEIGTLKAFGFSKKEILTQYIVYSLSATLIGSFIGVILGVYVFPKVIFSVYTNLYAIPKMIYTDYLSIILIGVLISIICIVGSTVLVIIRILKESTIKLLRPVAPLVGKKIFLEKIPFLWNKITFENKVTLRNIFRYKRRVIMTVAGIVSCTMILVSAFLIRDSITTVLDKQFNDIFLYDSMVYLDGKKLSYELDDIFKDKHISKVMYADLERVKIENTSANLLTLDDMSNLDNIIKIRNKERTIKLKNDGVVITSKLAKMYNINVNDTINIKMTDNSSHDLKVVDIAENYIGNYIYITKDLYQEKIGLYKLNIAYLKLDNIKNEENVITNLLNNNKNILSYLSIKNSVAIVQNMFVSLDKVVLIVVIFSLLLSLVILYSLAYIIISERQREIATLKVLGFDDEEVDMYLLREQMIIVVIGIIVGMIIGIFYSLILVDTLEINMVQFNKDLLFRNFIICICLMLAFTTVVGQLIHFRLRKIKMIESLKSVE